MNKKIYKNLFIFNKILFKIFFLPSNKKKGGGENG